MIKCQWSCGTDAHHVISLDLFSAYNKVSKVLALAFFVEGLPKTAIRYFANSFIVSHLFPTSPLRSCINIKGKQTCSQNKFILLNKVLQRRFWSCLKLNVRKFLMKTWDHGISLKLFSCALIKRATVIIFSNFLK